MVVDRQLLGQSEIAAPAFVGREREVATLGRALARPPAVVLVEAEPGAGKSRLVQEFLATSPGRRHRLLVAVCPPFREALTLGPIVDAVRRAADGVAGLPLSGLAGALRPLLPEWAAQLPPLPDPLEDVKAARHRLFRALAELMSALGISGVVVEDVHWADPVTMEFLVFLAASPAPPQQPHPACLVVTFRPAEVPSGALLALSSRLPAGTTQVRIAVPPLDVEQTAAMVSSMLGGERVSREFASFLHERTGGVPLAVEESVRLLRDRADLARRNGEWIRRRLADLQVSPTLRDSVLERVQRLTRPAQQVLQAAAVLAEPAASETLTRMAWPVGAPAHRALAEAVASGLLREDERSRLSFRHAFMAQVVYEAIPGAERRRLHLLAGSALESCEPLPVVQLTRHFREAGEVHKWSDYAERAAAAAVSGGDYTSAARLLDELLSTAALPPMALSRLGRELAGNALMRRETVDDLHRRVVVTLRGIVDNGGLAPDEQARLRSLLSRLLAQQGELTAARSELERAMPYLPQDTAEAARAMTYLGWPWLGPRPATVHLEWLQRVANIDPTTLSTSDRIMITADRATALLQLGEPSGWEVAGQLAGELTEEATNPEIQRLLIRTHLNLGISAMLWGHYDEAHRRLTAASGHADAARYPRLYGNTRMSLVELAWCTGDWGGLEQEIEDFLGTGDPEPMQMLSAITLLGKLRSATGGLRLAEETLVQALAEARGIGATEGLLDPAATLGRLWLAEGRTSEVLRLTEEPIEPIVSKGLWVFATEIAPVRVAALLAADRLPEAATLVARYEAGLRGRPVPAAKAGLATCQALLAQARGEPATASFASAASRWAQLPRPYQALLAREQEALSQLAADQPEPALSTLTEVWQRLSDLGARADADRVSRWLREHGVGVRRPPWRGGRRGYGSRPSPRELEVIRLVLAGKTNREIADALHKSPRTVAGQLASVMRKLGVSSRTELAVRVVEEGLTTGDER